ncbi:hypothetical protein C3731_13945 [Brucella oryzae]|uniref:Uncharacterized protein n=1 Tax=Brucella oryzae TaxID=335286 RepID=A0A2S7IXT3_9HYPH|nr:hypothetical protein C3731_13945 [Brucella oryzae]
MALAVSKARYCYRPFAKYAVARVIAHMNRQHTHALVLDTKTDCPDTECISHAVRFFEMIEINNAKRAGARSSWHEEQDIKG